MFNRSGVTKSTFGAPRQILANVEMQASVGCIVSADIGVTVNGKKIAKAGTPINIDMMNLNTPAVKVASGKPMKAVLLHDVDVTNGNANGTALYFGVVDVNRVESDVATAITSAASISGASPLLVFIKG